MSYQVYKLLHMMGILMVFLGLGGMIARGILGDQDSPKGKSLRRFTGMAHGIGLIIVLVSGFGLIAKLGVGFDAWVVGKMFIWLALGGLIVAAKRFPELGLLTWSVTIVLGVAAAYLAGFKPF